MTIPAEVRDVLGLAPGTAVEFLVREGEVVMRKGGGRGGDPIDRVYGRLRLDRPVDVLLDEMRGPRPTRPRTKKSAGKRR